MLRLMPIPHVLHVKGTIPTSRRTNDCGGKMFTGGPDVYARSGKTTYGRNHTKTDSIGLQLQAECWYEQE